MAQIFRPSTNTLSRLGLLLPILIAGGVAWLGFEYVRSPYYTDVGEFVDQPVPFSHEHHVKGVGLDCRFCHASVENAASAGIPSTEVCMTCHSQLYAKAPILQPVRDSFSSGQPLKWNRVHALPDFVFFNHSIHVNKGVGCTSCHGKIQEMPITAKAEPMSMAWCLNCHTRPEKFIRPKEEVFNMDYKYPDAHAQEILGHELLKKYDIQPARLTGCYVCHR